MYSFFDRLRLSQYGFDKSAKPSASCNVEIHRKNHTKSHHGFDLIVFSGFISQPINNKIKSTDDITLYLFIYDPFEVKCILI